MKCLEFLCILLWISKEVVGIKICRSHHNTDMSIYMSVLLPQNSIMGEPVVTTLRVNLSLIESSTVERMWFKITFTSTKRWTEPPGMSTVSYSCREAHSKSNQRSPELETRAWRRRRPSSNCGPKNVLGRFSEPPEQTLSPWYPSSATWLSYDNQRDVWQSVGLKSGTLFPL